MIAGALTAFLMLGCTEGGSVTPEPEPTPIADDLYEQYSSAIAQRPSAASATAAVSTRYSYLFVDDTTGIYQMDGVLEMQDPLMHMTQHLNANGMASEIEGYYDGSRLYNTFNGIHYYEDMSAKDVRDSMLMPLEPYAFAEEDIKGLADSRAENGDVTYSVEITEDRLADVFKDRYDFNDMDQLDECHVLSGIITDTFDSEGYFLKESSRFEIEFVYGGQKVSTTYEGSVSYLNYDDTEVVITDAMKSEFAGYVIYSDIDTDAITDDPAVDDAPEATVSATFRKRLVNRLGYSEESEGVYTQKYNENEAYTVDFNNHTFRYTNYSISYVYNWDGSIGSMGKCTVNFDTDTASSECTDETRDMIRKVRSYLQMELYYCGLSLEELQKEEGK